MQGNTREIARNRANAKPRFGIDAPTLVLGFAIGGPLLLAASLTGWFSQLPALAGTMIYTGLVLCIEAILMTLSSLYGKRIVARKMIAALERHTGEIERNPYHLRLPAFLADAVRRGGELVLGAGEAPPDFAFATLYRLIACRAGQPVADLPRRVFPAAQALSSDLLTP